MAREERKIFVYENWSSEVPAFMGILYANAARGAELLSFEYDENYLRKRLAERMCFIVRESWEGTARRHGLRRGQIEMMRPAFDASSWGK